MRVRFTVLASSAALLLAYGAGAFAQQQIAQESPGVNPYVGEKGSSKHANVHRFHHAAHYSLNSEHHHRAMAAGQASIESHPSHPAHHYHHHGHHHY